MPSRLVWLKKKGKFSHRVSIFELTVITTIVIIRILSHFAEVKYWGDGATIETNNTTCSRMAKVTVRATIHTIHRPVYSRYCSFSQSFVTLHSK